jgi:D-threonine aldolase
MMDKLWFEADNINDYDSPALLFYPDRIKDNIRKLLEHAKAGCLRPHVKSNKTAEVCRLMMDAGIHKFKSATISESEMLAMIKAPDVLLAYPLTIPKAKRFIGLMQKYSDTRFSFLIDNPDTAGKLSVLFKAENLTASVYIDLNVGMNRTGVLPQNALALYEQIISLPSLQVLGLHAYDGHIKDLDEQTRAKNCLQAFAPVLQLKLELENRAGHSMTLIAGGTPTFFIHAREGNRELSPGTFVFWDMGYTQQLPEQSFSYAAALVCRVISIPDRDKICVDLGYKAVAAETAMPRVYFLNAPEAVPVAHSEEHLVLKVPDSGPYSVGDIFYGIPWHICPSVALHDQALVIENNRVTGFWKVIARRREINV